MARSRASVGKGLRVAGVYGEDAVVPAEAHGVEHLDVDPALLRLGACAWALLLGRLEGGELPVDVDAVGGGGRVLGVVEEGDGEVVAVDGVDEGAAAVAGDVAAELDVALAEGEQVVDGLGDHVVGGGVLHDAPVVEYEGLVVLELEEGREPREDELDELDLEVAVHEVEHGVLGDEGG